MLKNETIERIWHCRREIETSKKILVDMVNTRKEEEERNRNFSKTQPTLKNAFGEKKLLELGVPSGDNSHRLFRLSPQLAEAVINAHIANKEAELIEAEQCARIELQDLNGG